LPHSSCFTGFSSFTKALCGIGALHALGPVQLERHRPASLAIQRVKDDAAGRLGLNLLDQVVPKILPDHGMGDQYRAAGRLGKVLVVVKLRKVHGGQFRDQPVWSRARRVESRGNGCRLGMSLSDPLQLCLANPNDVPRLQVVRGGLRAVDQSSPPAADVAESRAAVFQRDFELHARNAGIVQRDFAIGPAPDANDLAWREHENRAKVRPGNDRKTHVGSSLGKRPDHCGRRTCRQFIPVFGRATRQGDPSGLQIARGDPKRIRD
jgi:hypothetical protein